MASKTPRLERKRIAPVGQRRQVIKSEPVADPDDVLTMDEAKKIRHALKQVQEGKTKPLAAIKHELGL